MLIFGTRPEAIKMAPLVRAMNGRNHEFECITCVTGQHREMLDQVLDIFDIRPDFDLDVMRGDQTLFDVTVEVLHGLRNVLRQSRPDVVLVQGDTTTSFCGALAAFYLQIPVAHVEAGLRTHQRYSPFPEEMNRQLTTRLSDWHFAPTETSRANLIAEGVLPDQISVTGNTVIDALQVVRDRIYTQAAVRTRLDGVLASRGVKVGARRFILVTGHRRESFGDGFIRICDALRTIANRHQELDIIYPVHRNPNVQRTVTAQLSAISNIHLIDPLDYEPFVYLMNECHLVLTDSGGIQEEAPSLGKPVLVLRDNTERPEAVEAGTVRLVGTHSDNIVAAVDDLLERSDLYQQMAQAVNPYGDGRASTRILDVLAKSGKPSPLAI